jgi:hypothetical protein
VVLRHYDGVDAGRIGRPQAGAEVARVLDAVEHEQPHGAPALEDERLEIADRELGRGRNLDEDALVNPAVAEPVEIATRDALDGDAARGERAFELRELAAGARARRARRATRRPVGGG